MLILVLDFPTIRPSQSRRFHLQSVYPTDCHSLNGVPRRTDTEVGDARPRAARRVGSDRQSKAQRAAERQRAGQADGDGGAFRRRPGGNGSAPGGQQHTEGGGGKE